VVDVADEDRVGKTTPVGGADLRAKIAGAVAALVVIAAGSVAVWYRAVYNIWPGQDATERVHWCGRDYQYSGPAESRQEISSQNRWPIHDVGTYPPLGWPRDELFAATYPTALRVTTSCAVLVYVREGPDSFQPYSLLGGP
jgi:hypothetical protein